jgi:hypothetical protein
MSDRRLTEPQRKALLWLVPGKVCGNAPRNMSAALNSLRLFHPDLVAHSYEQTPLGRTYVAYQLTEAGIAERAEAA